jgi:hypothetical protein
LKPFEKSIWDDLFPHIVECDHGKDNVIGRERGINSGEWYTLSNTIGKALIIQHCKKVKFLFVHVIIFQIWLSNKDPLEIIHLMKVQIYSELCANI